MYFQLSRECEKWFAHIYEGNYSTKWDMFYLCLMVGFAAQRPLAYQPSQVFDLVDDYPGEFQTRGRLLVGLLLTTDLGTRSIELDERKSVYRSIANLVQSDSPSYLKDDGVRLMNKYSFGGFAELRAYFDNEKPRSIETFLRKYARCLDQCLAAASAEKPTSQEVPTPTSKIKLESTSRPKRKARNT